jgi:hypothetical protein
MSVLECRHQQRKFLLVVKRLDRLLDDSRSHKDNQIAGGNLTFVISEQESQHRDVFQEWQANLKGIDFLVGQAADNSGFAIFDHHVGLGILSVDDNAVRIELVGASLRYEVQQDSIFRRDVRSDTKLGANIIEGDDGIARRIKLLDRYLLAHLDIGLDVIKRSDFRMGNDLALVR